MAALAAVATARLTLVSLQLGCTAALVMLTVGLYVANRTAGLVAVWSIWLVAPLLRRLFFLSDPIETAEPLALAPFLVTAAVMAMEYTQADLSPRARRLLKVVAVGYAIGVPIGFLSFPTAAAFGLFAYGTAVGCFVIGYNEGREPRPVLPKLLLVAMPFVGLYALYQYFLPLPEWDQVWLDRVQFVSAGSPEEGRIRVWGTLNSPGTMGLVLGVVAVVSVASLRLSPTRLAGALIIFGALALTYVRSAWVAVAAALLVMLVVTRGAFLARIAVVALLLAVLGPVAFGGSTGSALSERVDTFGTLGEDESTQARISTPAQIVPVVARLPLGVGLGGAGEASTLADGGFRNTDNAYLSLLYQVGPFGFVLVMAGIVMAVRSAWRNAWLRPAGTDLVVIGVLSYFLVTMLGGDQLYGVGGMIFWYMAGLAARRDETGGVEVAR